MCAESSSTSWRSGELDSEDAFLSPDEKVTIVQAVEKYVCTGSRPFIYVVPLHLIQDVHEAYCPVVRSSFPDHHEVQGLSANRAARSQRSCRKDSLKCIRAQGAEFLVGRSHNPEICSQSVRSVGDGRLIPSM